MCKARILALALLVSTLPSHGMSGEADVTELTADRDDAGTYTFSVTVRHQDTGWDHYADRWEVLAPDGTVLATRVLHHPHVDEQPFTRSLRGVAVPDDVGRVTARARDSVHGYGGAEVAIDLHPR